METNKIIARTLIEIGEEGTVVITAPFMDQMKYLCSEISVVEWSGYVFFSTKGSPKNLKKFQIIPYYIHPMDKGTGGSTEFDDDGSLLELYKQMPELDPFNDTKYKYGKIHSHNNMDTYHSAVDIQDLQDQSGHYEYYFSLIVNNRMDLEAKAAFVAEIPSQPINPSKFEGSKWSLPKEEVLGVIDFEIELEDTIISIPKHFQERVVEIKKPKAYIPTHNTGRHYPNYPSYLDDLDEAEEEALVPFILGQNTVKEEMDVADTVLANVEDRRIASGKALITKFLSDRFKIYNSPSTVLFAIKAMSYVALNQIETPLVNWFLKLEAWEKDNIILFITNVTDLESNERYDTILEWVWDAAATIK